VIAGKFIQKSEIKSVFNLTDEQFSDWEGSGDDINGMSLYPVGDEWLIGYWIPQSCSFYEAIECLSKARNVFGDTGKVYRCVDADGNTYLDD